MAWMLEVVGKAESDFERADWMGHRSSAGMRGRIYVVSVWRGT